MIFGAVHCLAWTFQFPSYRSKLLWRVAIIVTFSPLCIAVSLFQIWRFNLGVWWKWRGYVIAVLSRAVFLTYILARFALIVEAFILLKSLSPGALQMVQWTNFIPHI
ncbi:hypothetical protein BD410DRAFT_288454 [Rickenella mellea]|uniref:Uncharacterized protein n=1 Tax=Rickenella mellea TaxID=50990 RepID=A0A4Y7Q367_9AGAM|nr:hypothetical protein BD410DRAFT_288454 [Rickenella mellea]